MDEQQRATFESLTSKIDDTIIDPRREHPSVLYGWVDIVSLVILGVICGCKSYEDVVHWGEGNEPWLKTFLDLSYGVPGEYALRKAFEAIDSEDLQEFFVAVTEELAQVQESLVHLDGKVLRGSLHKAASGTALLIVNAWAADNGLVIGQQAAELGTNEVSTLPKLIDTLPLSGATVTIDAAGTQVKIAQALVNKEADYILIAKDNQPNLRAELELFFNWQLGDKLTEESRVRLGYNQHTDGGHGRVEVRSVHCYEGDLLEGFTRFHDFAGARSIIRLQRERHLAESSSCEVYYYISSAKGRDDNDAARFNAQIRSHWAVENKLHWVLDVQWAEDASRVSDRNAARNLAIIRRLALNLVRSETSLGSRVSLRTRQFRASFDRSYLAKILAQALKPGVHVS